MTLGECLREIRESSDMTIADLAKLTGMTSSHISQMERDLASPSVSSLRKLAAALNVPVSRFFSHEEQDPGAVVRVQNRKKLKLPGDHIVYELLSPDFTNSVQMLLTRLEPGVQSSEEPMGHGGDECAYIMGGTVQFIIGGDMYLLNDGDSIYYEGRHPHKIINVGDSEVTIISAISPPGF